MTSKKDMDGLALPLDKLTASGWGTGKGSKTTGAGVVAMPSTARSAAAVENQASKGNLEDSINLEVMLKLREEFQKADADGGGDLDIDEFVAAFDGILPAGSREELEKLFLRIDANSDGTVDWDEFASFILLENEGAANLRESESVLQFHPSQMPDKVPAELAHRSPLMQIAHIPAGSGVGERYATAGRDGTVRMWSVKDLSHHKTICNGTAWVTSLVFTPMSNKLAVSSFARTIKLYDLVNGEVIGSQTELEHAVYTMDCAILDKAAHELMVVGDIGGCVETLELGLHDDPGASFIDSDVKREDQFRFKRHWKEELHTDWVSQVKYVPDLAGVVSSSLDNTLAITDIEQRVQTRRMVGHTKGVHAFEWSMLYKFVASAGMDRKVMLWNPFSCKHIAMLQGHAASVKSVAINERDNQIISVGVDKTIKVWDIRNHKCMQTFYDKEVYRPENIISAMIYDNKKRWLVTGNMKLKAWPLRSVINKTSGAHAASVSCCLYSPNFAEAITADHAGTVCIWVVATGRLRFRFTNAHGKHRITAMTLDANNRRLITGADNGELKMWNFSSGACIKTMVPKGIGQEVTGITCTQGMYFNNHILCGGWDRRITFFEDNESKRLSPIRQIGHQVPGHDGDILSVSIMDGSGTLATAGYEGHIIVWNVDSGAIKQRLVPPGLSSDIGFDGGPPDGIGIERVHFMFDKLHHFLVSASADRALRVWDALEGRMVLEIKTNHRKGESIVSLSCRKDNRFIATGDSGGWLKIWDCSALASMAGDQRVETARAKGLVREHACWLAHKGSVADLAWVGDDDPFVLSSSSDMNVTLWHKDGAKVGDFGKDEWSLRDQSNWATRGSEKMIADPNEGLKEKGDFSEQLKTILNASQSPARSRETSPERRARELATNEGENAAGAESPEAPAEVAADEPSFDEEPPEDTEGVPSTLIIEPPKAPPVARRPPKWKDPRMERVHTPGHSRRLNHADTQGRENTSIHHLLHISEIKDVDAKDPSKAVGGGPSGPAVEALPDRPKTVPSGIARSPSKTVQSDGAGEADAAPAAPASSRRAQGSGRARPKPSFATGFCDFSRFSTVAPDQTDDSQSKRQNRYADDDD